MITYPKDSPQRKTGTRACQILFYKLDADHWEYKQETGNDVGRDCILELSENDLWKNHKVEGQIKGKKHPQEIFDGTYVSFPVEIKTLNYALQAPNAFVLFVVDTTQEVVYFQAIQEYFINHPEEIFKLSSDQKTVNIRIPKDSTLPQKDDELQQLANKTYKMYSDGTLVSV